MAFTVDGNKTIIEFNINQLNGIECISGYLLKFHSEYRMPRWDEETTSFVRNVRAIVTINNKRLGIAIPEALETYKPYITHEHKSTFCFELMVNNQIIEKIEKLRQGGDLTFKLAITGEWRDEQNYSMQGRQDKSLIVNQKSWIDILKQMNYGDYILFEMPISPQISDKQKRLMYVIEKSKQQIYYGHYDEAVLNCRKALEVILKEHSLKAIREKYAGNKKKMSKLERTINLYGSLSHLTNLSAHLEDDNEIEVCETYFSRDEAIMILGATSAALSNTFPTKQNPEI